MDLHLPINYFSLRAESNFRFAIITTIYKCKSPIKSPLCHTLSLCILVRLSIRIIASNDLLFFTCNANANRTLCTRTNTHSHPQVGDIYWAAEHKWRSNIYCSKNLWNLFSSYFIIIICLGGACEKCWRARAIIEKCFLHVRISWNCIMRNISTAHSNMEYHRLRSRSRVQMRKL